MVICTASEGNSLVAGLCFVVTVFADDTSGAGVGGFFRLGRGVDDCGRATTLYVSLIVLGCVVLVDRSRATRPWTALGSCWCRWFLGFAPPAGELSANHVWDGVCSSDYLGHCWD